MTIKSWKAFLIWLAVICAAFIITAFKPSAPFAVLAEWGTVGFLGYITKRVAQKGKWFSNGTCEKTSASQGPGQ